MHPVPDKTAANAYPDQFSGGEDTSRLTALRERLAIYGFHVELVSSSLVVTAPVDHGVRLSTEIVCKPRPSDGDRLWFWHSWGEPIDAADHVVDAAVSVVGALKVKRTRRVLDGDVTDIKALFAEKFPGWNIIRTDRGNWWATRAVLIREDLNPDDASTIEASTPAELYVRLEAASK
ncbi:hypothetical protein E1281_35260 [Actinomadura sp. KC345]|uniref:hypothetical protein n=1 Tax=Actinomadura sp. KC345 TaxID=2530371 RepID=UPI00104EB5E2|nr:hypothetical protein [Actinomadura sp. KC345]TDC43370.1 hypothetical protein E1281_35260 [Actinomadura sp. KC345]